MPEITIGRIVLYKLRASDADSINKRRSDFDASASWPAGAMRHVGNSVQAGDVFPMIATKFWSPGCVNGQVMLDGNDLYWTTSVTQGDGEGQWSWPPRV